MKCGQKSRYVKRVRGLHNKRNRKNERDREKRLVPITVSSYKLNNYL